jgi:hypothetical protein
VARQDTKLEAEGAEVLVLGHLLLESISCFKAYTRFPGYDLIAANPENGRSARIQVKSRWATDYDRSFPIKNFECDFVVLAALNRGYRFRKKPTAEDTGRRSPQFYVFPVDVVQAAQNVGDIWGKVPIYRIPEVEGYIDSWWLIARFLEIER